MKNKIAIIVILLVLVLGGVGAYYKFSKNTTVNKDNKAGDTAQAQNQKPKIDLPKLDKNLKELKIKTIKEGTGRKIEKGNIAYVFYAGVLPNNKVFDSNAGTGRPVGFPIGEGAVIKGWDEALLGLKEGTEVIIDIPADKAYGEKGVKKPQTDEYLIPPNTPLRFDVLVAKVLTKEEAKKLMEEAMKKQAEAQKKAEAKKGKNSDKK